MMGVENVVKSENCSIEKMKIFSCPSEPDKIGLKRPWRLRKISQFKLRMRHFSPVGASIPSPPRRRLPRPIHKCTASRPGPESDRSQGGRRTVNAVNQSPRHPLFFLERPQFPLLNSRPRHHHADHFVNLLEISMFHKILSIASPVHFLMQRPRPITTFPTRA